MPPSLRLSPRILGVALCLPWLLALSAAMSPEHAAAQGAPAVTSLTLQARQTPADAAAGPGALAPAPPMTEVQVPGATASMLPSDGRAVAMQAEPTEFERLATVANGGRAVWRLGRWQAPVSIPARRFGPGRLPADYRVQVGDELVIAVWGSVEAEWRLRVDAAGRVTLPRAGPVALGGLALADVEAALRARMDRVFRAYELAATMGELGPLRVRVAGFVERPGEYVLPPLASVADALAQAQGTAPGGSLRRARLLRPGQEPRELDLYQLLDGTGSPDTQLQSGDVIQVDAALPQMAMLGAVNRAAVFEFQPGDTVADAIRLAGGFAPLADKQRLVLQRLSQRSAAGNLQLVLPQDLNLPLQDGDLVQAVSLAGDQQPGHRRNRRVRIDGEVRNPGVYLLAPGARLEDAVRAAGGLTSDAFVFAAELRRERVRLAQEANYERALQELETQAGRLTLAAAADTDRGGQIAADTARRQLLARLRARRPEGRVVLDVTPESAALPALELEDDDHLRIPARGPGVGVFGSVVNAGTFAHDARQTLGSYLRRAGGPTEGADADGAFVVRANGSVVSAREGSWWGARDRFESLPALPGDTLFLPEQLQRITWLQAAKDWTQVLYQLGVGLAAFAVIK